MKKIQLTVLAILCFWGSPFSQESKAIWQLQPIQIDGKISDWITKPRFFNAESNVQYEFRNDAQNLYLILKTTERATQMQLMRAGFTIRVKINTKPPTKCSITFPEMKKGKMPPMWNKQGKESDILVEKSSMNPDQMLKDTVFLQGFRISQGAITSDNKNENTICFARNKGEMEQTIYELCIPLREFFGDNFVLENISTFPIQLQVLINAFSESSDKKSDMHGGMEEERTGGGMGGQARKGMGGGMNGGMGGSQAMGERPHMPSGEMFNTLSKKSFSIDFYLSNGK